MTCHSRASNYVLGLCTLQLNRDFDYGAALCPGHATDNQLRTLEHLGLLEVNWWDDASAALHARAAAAGVDAGDRSAWVGRQMRSADPDGNAFGQRRSALLSRSPAATNRLVSPADASQPLESRARSYLQANCSSCHVGAGGGNAVIELEYLSAHETIPLAAMRAIDARPLHATFDLPDPRLIASGDPARSVLLARMSRRGPGQMPQVATTIVDDAAVTLVRRWIESLPAGHATLPAGRRSPR